MTLLGAIHVHSRYSDGEFTLPELRAIFLRAGCGFVCMTDHAESFDREKLQNYRSECARLSDQDFRFVCGLEYECRGRMHILGYGCTDPAPSQDPQQVIAMIRERGGVAVIAHPGDGMFPEIEKFSTLPNGIEVWNTKYDGQYAPRPQTFRLLYHMQEKDPATRAFYGLDLHWKKQFREMQIELDCADAAPEAIVAALRAGSFVAHKGELRLASDGRLPDSQLDGFQTVHDRSSRMRSFLKAGKRWADRLGVKVPAGIKAQLRRIF